MFTLTLNNTTVTIKHANHPAKSVVYNTRAEALNVYDIAAERIGNANLNSDSGIEA